MTETATKKFSPANFIHSYPPGIEHHFWNRARNSIIAETLHRYSKSRGRVLEIGCGTGVVVANLRALGYDCWGSDLGTLPPAVGVENFLYLGQDCHDLKQEFRHSVTTLMLFDVIEHVEAPVAFMAALRDSFPNVDTLIVTVPARQELWSNYDEYFGHFRRYDRPLLISQLEAAGFMPLTQRYFFHALYLAMRILTLRENKRQTQVHAPTGWKRIIHRILATVFTLEARLLPSWLIGTSILAVASAKPTNT